MLGVAGAHKKSLDRSVMVFIKLFERTTFSKLTSAKIYQRGHVEMAGDTHALAPTFTYTSAFCFPAHKHSVMVQPENSGDSAIGRTVKRAKETVHYVTRGAGYLATAAKQAVTGTDHAAESQQPAGETTVRCAAGLLCSDEWLRF